MIARPRHPSPPRRAAKLAAYALLVTGGAASAEPALLPWTHHARIGRFDVRAISPIPAGLRIELARAEALLGASPIDRPNDLQRLYLTDGGWRFRLHALGSGKAFAVHKPLLGAIVLNDTDARNLVFNGTGRRRSVSGIVAHETTHANIEGFLGVVAARLLPAWKAEGYADHVARESTLDDRTAARMIAQGSDDAALAYWHHRRRVEKTLSSGRSVEDLLTRT